MSLNVKRLAAPILLCCVVVLQLIAVNKYKLTPWKGGGFGMFSGFDNWMWRSLEIVGVDANGAPISLKDFGSNNFGPAAKFRVFPRSPIELAEELGWQRINSVQLRRPIFDGIGSKFRLEAIELSVQEGL